MTSRYTLHAERARLIDDKFLRGLSVQEAARLAEIDQELDRRDAPAVARLKRHTSRRRTTVAKQITALKAKIAENASDHPKAKSAGLP